MRIAEEEDVRKRWQKENVRRRHNYLPFIMELLKYLAAEDQLDDIYKRSKERSVEQQKKKDAKKAAATAAASDESMDTGDAT